MKSIFATGGLAIFAVLLGIPGIEIGWRLLDDSFARLNTAAIKRLIRVCGDRVIFLQIPDSRDISMVSGLTALRSGK